MMSWHKSRSTRDGPSACATERCMRGLRRIPTDSMLGISVRHWLLVVDRSAGLGLPGISSGSATVLAGRAAHRLAHWRPMVVTIVHTVPGGRRCKFPSGFTRLSGPACFIRVRTWQRSLMVASCRMYIPAGFPGASPCHALCVESESLLRFLNHL